MKLILLLSVLCFTSAFAGDYITMDMYVKSGCKDADLVVHVNTMMKLGCSKVSGGSAEYKLDGKKIVYNAYASTDCSGAKTGTADTGMVTGTCAAQGSMSRKFGTMSASVWEGHTTGGGNLFSKHYSGSDTCGGDVGQELVYLSKAQGMCGAGENGFTKITWTTTARTDASYSTADCTGTATATKVENFKVCNNETDSGGKRSSYTTGNPAASSGTKSTGFTSTLFLLCVALFTNSFL